MINRIILFLFLLNPYCLFAQSNYSDLEAKYKQIKIDEFGDVVEFIDPYVICVESQSAFDSLRISLKAALDKKNKYIIVRFSDGDFFFKENHMAISRWDYPESYINFIGSSDTKIIGSGSLYLPNSTVIPDGSNHKNSFFDKKDNKVDYWTQLSSALDTIQVLNYEDRYCRLKMPETNSLMNEKLPVPLQITEWYYSRFFTAEEIKDGWLYFHADANSLAWNPHTKTIRINSDWGFGKKMPRYRLFLGGEVSETLYESSASTWMRVYSSCFGGIQIQNLHFVGNSANAPLFSFQLLNTNHVLVSNCIFSNLKGGVVNVLASDNFVFKSNTIVNCDGMGVYCNHLSKNAQILNNDFKFVCLDLKNSYAIKCEGSNFLIKGNKVSNFGYGGIGLGIGFKVKKQNKINGIVENNELWYEQEMFQNPSNHNLMDSGAIYTWTILDHVIIRNNYVHDYNGCSQNRGIFCDDGGKNLVIYGNVVVRIKNYYPIDLRLVRAVANEVPDYNTNNVMFANLVDSAYRFQGRTDMPDNCVSFNNIVLTNSTGANPINNISNKSEDIYIKYSLYKGKYKLSKKDTETVHRYIGISNYF